MPNISGVVKYVYDNRLMKDGSPNKYPNYTFGINDQKIVLWSAIKPVFLEKGKKLSVAVQASKKNGSLFVQTKPDKSPMIQELPSENKEDTSFNPEELEAQLQEAAKEFDADLTVETKKPFNKDEYMFVMALAKSAIESQKINVNKEEIDSLIKDLKYLYQVNFHNS
jgi:phosphotransferase system HPr-like phosphotransfer protein